MKERVSVTLDKESIKKADSMVKTGRYRNRSHAFEAAIELLDKIESEKNKGEKK